MLPLAVGAGPGAEERRATAVVVIGGQTLSLLLTLVAIPVLYTVFDDLSVLVMRRLLPDILAVFSIKPGDKDRGQTEVGVIDLHAEKQ
jgi:hypothetical protein